MARKRVKLTDTIPKIKKVVETKVDEGREWRWRVLYAQYDQMEVYASLCEDLMRSKVLIPHAPYSVKYRVEDDCQIIEVWYSKTSRATYRIEPF